jgi:hypothetical protein
MRKNGSCAIFYSAKKARGLRKKAPALVWLLSGRVFRDRLASSSNAKKWGLLNFYSAKKRGVTPRDTLGTLVAEAGGAMFR